MDDRVVILVSYSSSSLPLKDMNMFSLPLSLSLSLSKFKIFITAHPIFFSYFSSDPPPIHMGKLLKVFLYLCTVLTSLTAMCTHKIPLLFPPSYLLLFNQQASLSLSDARA
jgi:predicted small lipoprotein YifL